MTNKEFDRWLRESLSDQKPDANPGDWDSFVKRIEDSETTEDTTFDQEVRGAVSTLGTEYTPDWERMEGMLDAEVLDFDDQVRDSVEKIDVPYNPRTWPILDARLSQEERTRRRVIVAKVLEIAAILIALFTFYNLFPAIQEGVKSTTAQGLYQSTNDHQDQASVNIPEENTVLAQQVYSNADHKATEVPVSGEMNTTTAFTGRSGGLSLGISSSAGPEPGQQFESRDATLVPVLSHTDVPSVISGTSLASVLSVDRNAVAAGAVNQDPGARGFSLFSALSPLGIKAFTSSFAFEKVPAPAPPLRKPSGVRFGMMAAADINTLFVPDEFFYSQGRAIRFSAKEIEAGGYTAGASLVFDQPRFLVETGVTYSSKTFGPDRSLFIGTSPDQHALDFENITLDIVSVPLYFHLKLDGKGLWRFYAVGGASLHVIANAQYDLIAENTNPPASAAPLDPTQIQNQREVQRVREHMLDGAKFNSKAYLTAAGGFGVEHFLNSRTSVFVQPMYHYQISFFGLIDQNGKHLRSTSLLLGTRISL